MGQTVDKIAVVGHHKNGSVKALNRVLQSLSRADVKVVCGLVRIRKLAPESIIFTIATLARSPPLKVSIFLKNIVSLEKERRKRVSDGGLAKSGRTFPNLLQNRVFIVQAFLSLVIVGKSDANAEIYPALSVILAGYLL